MSYTPLTRPERFARDRFARFLPMTTRWVDNDLYGHLNNVVYLQLFDTAVNALLIEAKLLDPLKSEAIGLVAQNECAYFQSLKAPEPVEVGVAVALLGRSSVRYRLAVFVTGAALAAAQGGYSHVYVDRETRRPTPIPEGHRNALVDLIRD
jgi:acyl-CoA thioester hydrolase